MICRASTPQDLLGPLNEVEAKHAPTAIFTAGDARLLEIGARVSIVGRRCASPEGVRLASELASLCAAQHVVVVSGLAEGVDTAAHVAAIGSGGRTIGVIGTPLDRVYPRRNAALQNLISRDHLLISPFPQGAPIRRGNFLSRNRTMALISDATVIIEAGESSGSLQQGWEALRLGRPLFIARCAVDRVGLAWPAAMLGHGASILSDETLDDLLDSLPPRVTVGPDGELPF